MVVSVHHSQTATERECWQKRRSVRAFFVNYKSHWMHLCQRKSILILRCPVRKQMTIQVSCIGTMSKVPSLTSIGPIASGSKRPLEMDESSSIASSTPKRHRSYTPDFGDGDATSATTSSHARSPDPVILPPGLLDDPDPPPSSMSSSRASSTGPIDTSPPIFATTDHPVSAPREPSSTPISSKLMLLPFYCRTKHYQKVHDPLRVATPPLTRQCLNCHTTTTPKWRHSLDGTQQLCMQTFFKCVAVILNTSR